MRCLDLFCGAGLVADGLMAAGWDVVGVDIAPQRNYPSAFLQADVLTLDPRFLRWFDAIWASPPCQFGTSLRFAPGAKSHINLIPETRNMLVASGLPYVIENVDSPKVRACMIDPVTLCGSMFGLGTEVGGTLYHLQRHRLFETNWGWKSPRTCSHQSPVVGVYGGHARVRAASAGGRGTADFVGHSHRQVMGRAMGIPDDRTLTTNEISQGIPPRYAKRIGGDLLARLLYGMPTVYHETVGGGFHRKTL